MKGMNCNEKYILHIENSRAEPVIWENLGKYGGTDMLGTYKIRTDLAVEARERFTEDNVEVRGVEVQEDYNKEKDIRTTVVKITTENGARAMGRPQGTYITIESEGLSAPDEDYHREVSEELSGHFRAYCWTWKSGDYGGFIGTGSNWKSSYNTPSDPRVWAEKYRKADSSCDQRNCSRRNGADWNGNFGNRGGRGENNTA